MHSEMQTLAISSRPGIYFVRLLGETLISVNDTDANRRDASVKVNSDNCKYGKSVNLRSRYAAYCRTFGAERLSFQVLAFDQEPSRIERLLHAHFAPYRMLGRTGRANEWLRGICPDHAFAQAAEICSLAQSATFREAEAKNRDADDKGQSAAVSSTDLGPADIVSAAEYLQQHGMSEDLLTDLHHFPRQTYKQTLNYFRSKSSIRGTNMRYAKRLDFVVSGHQQGGCFSDLVAEAKAICPLPGKC